MTSMDGKVCIVTGSSSGLGQAIAVMLAQRGASVTLCGRDPDRLQSALTSCVAASGGEGQCGRFLTVCGDVLKATVRGEIIQQTMEKFGRLDVLVANAGVTEPVAGIETASEQTYDNIMDVNVKSVFFLIQLAVPQLATSNGNIVVISSLTSQVAASPNIIYPMSKAAIDHMIRCLAVDLGPKNIRVNGVNPGFIPTRIRRMFGDNQEALDSENSRQQKQEIEKQPLGEAPLTKEAIAEAVCFLSSPAAMFVTGQSLLVDAGRSFMLAYGTTAPK